MEIILRDVSSLARACADKADAIIRKLMIEADLRFSTYQPGDVEKQLNDASTQAMRDLSDVLELFYARSQLRTLSAQHNARNIDALLAERNHYLDPAGDMLHNILEMTRTPKTCAHDADQVRARLAGLARRMETVTQDTVRDTIQVSRLSPTDIAKIEDQLAEIRRAKRRISRMLAQENMAVTLNLPDHVVTILQKHKIV